MVGIRIWHTCGAYRHFLAIIAIAVAVLACGPIGNSAAQQISTQTRRIQFEARMTEAAAPIGAGIEWRIFSSDVNNEGKLTLLAQSEGGIKAFDITPGEYFVHAAYGHASALRRIVVETDAQRETFIFNAGAMQLNGETGNAVKIPAHLLRFDIYANEADERGVRQLIAHNVQAGEIVPFPAGTYHVVSRYGRLNAEIRADIRVESGKVTQATIEHRAARMSFRLVEKAGGDAIANTAWSILTESGDVITESSSAFPAFVLSEGTYTAIARNDEKIYSRDFPVISGVNQDIELLAE
jgi:hypothetical protein